MDAGLAARHATLKRGSEWNSSMPGANNTGLLRLHNTFETRTLRGLGEQTGCLRLLNEAAYIFDCGLAALRDRDGDVFHAPSAISIAASRPFGIAMAMCSTPHRPSRTRAPGIWSDISNKVGLLVANRSSSRRSNISMARCEFWAGTTVAFGSIFGIVPCDVLPSVTPTRRPGLLTSEIVAIGETAGTRYPSSSEMSVWLNATSTARAGVALLTVKSTSPAFIPPSTSAIR